MGLRIGKRIFFVRTGIPLMSSGLCSTYNQYVNVLFVFWRSAFCFPRCLYFSDANICLFFEPVKNIFLKKVNQ
jgi:hypothetical protein